ncbi:MAG: hypothetical protein UV20_C0014G0017 [Candidatus Magasanikbacteria bacterium GW2011_GWA2_42_32]|uniref:NYN domain-containing protein n=1 Tax=Candidatus Magasanikbacteria bacterium GW2011_GWA2_42_32 TaxID=1619039 RepID=A0A0G1A5Q7_9BACT|nr:MAG: hypothetical protein UV20_C0014G0017 [Candidatus Magasanikbacteria bacterium GW2011_GWA2_42_32]KKU97231.1 MAG: hypothetical protein UY29_C0001G0025 [Parcubacteria group bacterium GW2011_GWC2_48_17]
MSSISASYSGPREIKYLFVDGGCFRQTLETLSKRYFGVPIDIDYQKLAGEFTKVFYYDALPVKEEEEVDAAYELRIRTQDGLLNHIRSFDKYHVYEGDARRRPKRGLEQKKVDVMIAVDMLTHSVRRNMHKATLLTGDLDFKPLIDALVQEGMFVTLWYPKEATNPELITAADGRRVFDIRSAYENATDDFRNRFRLPFASSGPKGVGKAKLEQTWWDKTRGPIELYRDDDGYLVVFVEGVNPGYYLHFRHHGMDLLKMYMREYYDISMP